MEVSAAVTLKTLALDTGLSTATISRGLKNDRLIHPETRSRIFAAAARFGYERPVRRPRRVEASTTRFSLLVLLPPEGRQPVNYVVSRYLYGLTSAASEEECSLAIEEIRGENFGLADRRPHLPRALLGREAHAVILAGLHHPADVQAISELLPVVSIQWEYETATDLVLAFNARGIGSMVGALVEHGHRRIAYVGESYPASFYRERQIGFLDASLAHGLSLDPGWEHRTAAFLGEDRALTKLLREQAVTALVCANDAVAQKVAEQAEREGLRIPDDLSLTGFDFSQRRLPNGCSLYSYDARASELGRTAVQAALLRLREPGSSRFVHSRSGIAMPGYSVARR